MTMMSAEDKERLQQDEAEFGGALLADFEHLPDPGPLSPFASTGLRWEFRWRYDPDNLYLNPGKGKH
jgi:hypothetical protein